MNKNLSQLQPYPFEKLARLLEDLRPATDKSPIALSIGEPKHPPPEFVLRTLRNNLDKVARYPATRGLPELRQAIASWLKKRFGAIVSADTQILPVNGTREALFAFAQCIVDNRKKHACVVMPNPFYQIYEGATILAGAQPYFLNTHADNRFLPDLDSVPEAVWQNCLLFQACSPGNPTGTVLTEAYWQKLIALADQYDFVIAADECYSEIYTDEQQPPTGLLEVCNNMGRNDYQRCVVFHSLSKRSNLPGLRSGFVAGDAQIIEQFRLYRTYHGCVMSVPTQLASIAAWEDEAHVRENRDLYRLKYQTVAPILSPWIQFNLPEAGFYLWPEVPDNNDTGFARKLFIQEHVSVLPGSYLSRDTASGNPGRGRIRMALVAGLDQCIEAAKRIACYCEHIQR